MVLHSHQKWFPFLASLGRKVFCMKVCPVRALPIPRAGLGFGVWGLAQVRTLLAALPQPAWEAVAGAQHMVTASSILALAHLVAVNPKESVWTSWKCKTFLFSTASCFFCINSISSFHSC